MASRIKELLKNSILFTVANLSSKVLVFLMIPFYTTVLTSEQYGDSSIIQTTSTFLFPLLTCLISQAVLRFCFLDEKDNREIFTIGVKYTLHASIACLILLAISWYFLPVDFKTPYIWYIPALVLSNSFSRLLHAFCRGIYNVKCSAIAGIIQTLVIVAMNLVFLGWLNYGVGYYLLSYVVGDLAGVIYMVSCTESWRYLTTSIKRSLAKEMLKYSLPLVPNQLSWWAMSSLNQYIVLTFMGISSVGIYTATLRIPSLLTVLTDIFAEAWLLSALRDYGCEESRRFICKMSGLFFSVTVILTSCIIILSHPLAIIMLKGNFSEYWYIAPLLFIGVCLGAITNFLGSIFSAERKNRIQASSTIIGAIVSVLCSVFTIQKFGIMSIALSTFLGYLVITIIRYIGTKKYIKLEISVSKLFVQTSLLLIESYFVVKEYYFFASISILGIILYNHNALSFLYKYVINRISSKII